MPRFAANISMLFPELPFLDRFEAAAAAGFKGVEFLFPYEYPASEILKRIDACGLTLALFNLPPGDWAAGERGLAALPGREKDFASALELAIEYASALGCRQLHAMAGVMPRGIAPAACEATYLANLRYASAKLEPLAIRLLIEPLNRRDAPDYFLGSSGQARSIIEKAGSSNLYLQMDLYHCQITEGDLAERTRALFPLISHFQIAGVPGRHEPDAGEINYPFVFDFIDRLGYQGWIGCEYRPKGNTGSGLGWARPYGVIPPAA